MAVKICTTGGSCISCGASFEAVQKTLRKALKDKIAFMCCGTSCVRVSEITTIEEVAREEREEEQKRGGRRSEEETEEFIDV